MNPTSKVRNPALDIIRCFAFLFVVCVHFFLNSSFYEETVAGIPMYIMMIMRALFINCVPLFILLTGYLMTNKKLTLSYYGKLSKTVGIYILASLGCVAYKMLKFGQAYTIGEFVRGFFSFEHANYSWYIEMYIGLFLLCPFLNVLYHGLETQKKKLVLIGTLLFMTALPSIVNIAIPCVMTLIKGNGYNYSFPLIPDFWETLYASPLTYYFVGCYLREYPIKIKCRNIFIISLFTLILNGTFNYIYSYGSVFKFHTLNDYQGILQVIQSVLFFTFFTNLNYEKVSAKFSKFIAKISELTLGAYLISWIFDNYLYEILRRNVGTMTQRLYWFPVMVTLVVIGSLIASYLLNLIYSLFSIIFTKIKSKFVKEKATL